MAVDFNSYGILSQEQLRDAEQRLRFPFPPEYRAWLAATNGGRPRRSVELPEQSFLWEDRAYGLRPEAPLDDLVYCYFHYQDRFTPDYLPVADVSGGMLAVKVAGDRRGSVWFWDDDDPRASDDDTPQDTERLLRPCGASWDDFLARLEEPPDISDEELAEFARRQGFRIVAVNPDVRLPGQDLDQGG